MSEISTESVYCINNVTDLKSRTFIYTWTIRNFKLHVNSNNEYLTSHSKFENGKTLWNIKLRVNQPPQTYGSLHTVDRRNILEVTFDKNFAKLNNNYASYLYVYIIKSDGNETEVFNTVNPIKSSNTIVIPQLNVPSISDISKENSLWLQNGQLTIRFKLWGAISDAITLSQPALLASCVNKQQQFVGFNNIFNNKQFSDVKIVIDDKEFYVYKGILASRSPVFAAMFSYDMQENIENIVKVEDVKYEIMQEVLRFMYTGKVNNIQSIAADLLPASDKYEIEDLKLMCEEILINDLKVDTVTSLLILAEKHAAKELKQYALEFFKLHMREVVKNENYEKEMTSLLTILPEVIKSLANS